jgi:acyl-coenzyme A thioesterase PaaI-like protein
MSQSSLNPLAGWQETTLPFSQFVRSFVSGDPTGDRIQIRYFKTDEADVLFGKIIFGPGAEGPPGHAHGGAQAAVLDEICGGALWVWGYKVVAAKLETEFSQMVPLNEELILEGRLSQRNGRKLFTDGSLKNLAGDVLARAKVLFIELSPEHLKNLGTQKL